MFIEAFKRAYQMAYYRWRLKLERQREIYRQVQRNGAIEVKSTTIED